MLSFLDRGCGEDDAGVLRILGRFGQRACFFLGGSWVE